LEAQRERMKCGMSGEDAMKSAIGSVEATMRGGAYAPRTKPRPVRRNRTKIKLCRADQIAEIHRLYDGGILMTHEIAKKVGVPKVTVRYHGRTNQLRQIAEIRHFTAG